MMLLHWYENKSCALINFSGIFTSIIFGTAPPFIHMLLKQFGHLNTWRILGIVTLLFFVPLIWAKCRDTPKVINPTIDLFPSLAENTSTNASKDKTLTQALKSFDFWIFMVATINSTFITTGF
jgi:hypothetical protein